MRTKRSRATARIAVAAVVALTACLGDDPDVKTTSSSGGTSSSSGGTTGASVASFGFDEGCFGWTSTSADAVDEAAGRTAPKACRVCNKQTESGYNIMKTTSAPIAVGDKFRVSAWVRAPAGADAAGTLSVGLWSEDNQLGALDQGGGSATTALRTDDWIEVKGELEITKPNAVALRILVSSQDQSPTCFIVDDVTVTRP